MVDVKLDVGGSSFKSLSKKKWCTGTSGVLMYLLFISAVTILVLDAAEFSSLGIIKNVLGLKVMKMDDFSSMTAAYEAQLAQKDKESNTLLSERDALQIQVNQLTDERNRLTQERDDKQTQLNEKEQQLNDGNSERDSLSKEIESLNAKNFALQAQIDQITKIGEATVKKTAEVSTQ